MRILHLSTWETGGAAIAATRLSHILNELDETSEVFHMSSRFPAYIDAAIGKLAHFTNPIFHSYNYFGQNISAKIKEFNPDIIHIHWIGAGFVTPESLAKFNLPIVWTLHDLWSLCGAEHLPGSNRLDEGYKISNRPVGESGLDLDRYVWERKNKTFKDLNITFVSPSKYILEQAKKSKLISNHKLICIPNGIDTNIFDPIKSERKTILFVAMNPGLDPNKGYADFKQSITYLSKKYLKKYSVKVIGGEIKDERNMAQLYQGAVVTVVSSKMENLPFVIMESMACGTPVVAYNVGGIPDLIDHKVNGYLARPGDTKDLAYGIESILKSPKIAAEYSKSGRAKIIKHFSMGNIAKRYLDLYRQM